MLIFSSIKESESDGWLYLYNHYHPRQDFENVFKLLARWQCRVQHEIFGSLSFLNNRGSLSLSFSRSSSGYRDSSDESTNNRGMVDDVVGGVGRGVLLDSDLGDMVDLVVDLVTNLVDNRSCGNVDSWGDNMVVSNGSNSNSRGSLDLNSLDSGNSWGGNMVGSSGNSNCGSRGNTCVIHTT